MRRAAELPRLSVGRLVLPGVAETLVRAVKGVHPDLHGLMYSNVLLTGASMQRTVCGEVRMFTVIMI